MRILEIIKDIFDDTVHSADSYTDMYRDMGSTPWDARRNGFDIGFFVTMLPNILGFLLGLAITRMFGIVGSMVTKKPISKPLRRASHGVLPIALYISV